jgi:hypothetical protein
VGQREKQKVESRNEMLGASTLFSETSSKEIIQKEFCARCREGIIDTALKALELG